MKAGMLQAALCVLLAFGAQAQDTEENFKLTTLHPVRQGINNGLGITCAPRSPPPRA